MPDTFGVSVGVCVHRNITMGAWKTLWSLAKCPNPKVNPLIQEGDALISRSRNKVATHFLQNTQDEMLMFLDDDIEISSIDATRMLWEVHTNRWPILGGLYALKDPEKGGFAFKAKDFEGEFEVGDQGSVIPAKSVSSGCMIIRREVFEKMVKSEKAHWCKQGYYTFFQHREMLVDGEWDDMSEDWYFTQVARDLGFGVFIDTRPKTKHFGPFPYSWDFVSLMSNGGIPKRDTMIMKYDVLEVK